MAPAPQKPTRPRPDFDPILMDSAKVREAPVRFGYGLGVERFERFRFSVPAVPVPLSVSEKTVPTVPP